VRTPFLILLAMLAACASPPTAPTPEDALAAQEVLRRMQAAQGSEDWATYLDCLVPEDRPVLAMGLSRWAAEELAGETEALTQLEEVLRRNHMPTSAVILSFRGGEPRDYREVAKKWAGDVDCAAFLKDYRATLGPERMYLPPVVEPSGEPERVDDVLLVPMGDGHAWCVSRDGRWYVSLMGPEEESG